ncbi:hypothetical protein [Labrys wisconsinensis]|uniref:Uncharacterized protein n=1 Tax=Labrys wisconsinensis TaxID=425677 RepID=A0ABU0J9I5_9HYPH|nr:hypothetical protein [Labrys wisconsinensis]MDQ0470937.1 hypothetical protein [Labrys wisconsinensis]
MTELAHAAVGAAGELRIGELIGRTGRLLARRPLRFLALAAIGGAPVLLLSLPGASETVTWSGVWIALAVQTLLGFLVQGVTVHGAFQEMRGRPFTLVGSAAPCLRHALPLLVAAVLTTVATAAGFAALVFPGFMATTAWFVTAPACVVERLGPIASMERSAALTRGYRWKIFALFLIVGAAEQLTVQPLPDVLGGVVDPTVANLLQYGVQTLWSSVDAVLAAVVYHALRAVKEGIDLDQIAGVFD